MRSLVSPFLKFCYFLHLIYNDLFSLSCFAVAEVAAIMVFCLVYYYIPGNCDGRPLCVCVICVNGSRDRSDMSGAHTIWRQKVNRSLSIHCASRKKRERSRYYYYWRLIYDLCVAPAENSLSRPTTVCSILTLALAHQTPTESVGSHYVALHCSHCLLVHFQPREKLFRAIYLFWLRL